MKRRWLSVIGALLVLTATAQAVAYVRIEGVSAVEFVAVTLLGTVGALLVIAGEGRSLGPITWFHTGGLGFVALGCWFAFTAGTIIPTEPSAMGWLMGAGFVAGALGLVFIGIDWLRGGYHLDLEKIEPGPLRG